MGMRKKPFTAFVAGMFISNLCTLVFLIMHMIWERKYRAQQTSLQQLFNNAVEAQLQKVRGLRRGYSYYYRNQYTAGLDHADVWELQQKIIGALVKTGTLIEHAQNQNIPLAPGLVREYAGHTELVFGIPAQTSLALHRQPVICQGSRHAISKN